MAAAPVAPQPLMPVEIDQFCSRILSLCVEVGECLEFRGAPSKEGGLYASYRGKKYLVRRILWQAKYGEIPAGRLVGVSCGNKRCVCHLQMMTTSQRNKRTAKQGKFSTVAIRAKIAAAKRRDSKLAQESVPDILAAEAGKPLRELCAALGISESYANMIRIGRFRVNFSGPFAGLGARA